MKYKRRKRINKYEAVFIRICRIHELCIAYIIQYTLVNTGFNHPKIRWEQNSLFETLFPWIVNLFWNSMFHTLLKSFSYQNIKYWQLIYEAFLDLNLLFLREVCNFQGWLTVCENTEAFYVFTIATSCEMANCSSIIYEKNQYTFKIEQSQYTSENKLMSMTQRPWKYRKRQFFYTWMPKL